MAVWPKLLLAALLPFPALGQLTIVPPKHSLLVIPSLVLPTPSPTPTRKPFTGIDIEDLNDSITHGETAFRILQERNKAESVIAARAATLSWLGAPKGDLQSSAGRVYFREFAGGNLYTARNSDAAYAVTGDTLKLYLALGAGKFTGLGLPTGDTLPLSDRRGWGTEFQSGAIYWTPQTGAHEVYGDIFKTWNSLGRERSWLGYPVTGELAASGGNAARISSFENGQLSWKGGVTTPLNYRDLILNRFKGLGGVRSPLGLPQDRAMPIVRNGDGAVLAFRGGSVTVPYSAPLANPVATTRVVITFVGLECKARQEKEDEISGAISVFAPSSLKNDPLPISDWRFKDGVRIRPDRRVVYDGPPADVVVTTSLVELDTSAGNPMNVAIKIVNALKETASTLQAAGAALDLDDVVGAYAREGEQVMAQFEVILKSNLFKMLVGLFDSPDDPYPPGMVRFRAQDLRSRAANRRTLRRPDDPNVIEYTDEVTVTAVDNGGDRGIYTFYFDIDVLDEHVNL